MQTLPKLRARFQAMKAALQDWLIRVGLDLPPGETNNVEKHLSEEQEQARNELRFRQLPRPPRSPR